MQLNEDDGNETLTDVIWSAMINEGDDCDENSGKKESEFIWTGELIKCQWILRA